MFLLVYLPRMRLCTLANTLMKFHSHASNCDIRRSHKIPCPGIKFHLLLIHNIILFFLLYLQFSPPVSAIRKGVSLRDRRYCRTTVQGRFLISDDNGNMIALVSISICRGCNIVSQCCNSYEYCVSCCLNPVMSLFVRQTLKELALKVKIAKPVTAGNYESVFDFCAGRCRHNSASVVHENAYQSEYHHCFSIPSNFSGSQKLEDVVLKGISMTGSSGTQLESRLMTSSTQLESRLAGINIIIGRQGESCDIVCKSDGQSCVPNKLSLLNQCEVIQKYMKCKGACLSSIGADQPAEVVDDAPRHLLKDLGISISCSSITQVLACTLQQNLSFPVMAHTVIQGGSVHVHN
ncbi:UPF0454 protein C12orf49 homolog [Striga asiatica]|uniref:SREBP regulating gene protein n=1 Tax=Striga asiatica TaxID=4170 RepID=A0A5A7P5P4_STRAF|nr:UPF0454 protein C12orf49 homolog [Striga asiatica]